MLRFRASAPTLGPVYAFTFEVADLLDEIGAEPVTKEGAGSDFAKLLRQLGTFARGRDAARMGAPDPTTAATPSPTVVNAAHLNEDPMEAAGARAGEEEQPLRSFSEVIAANAMSSLGVPSTSATSAPLPTPAPPGLDPLLWTPLADPTANAGAALDQSESSDSHEISALGTDVLVEAISQLTTLHTTSAPSTSACSRR